MVSSRSRKNLNFGRMMSLALCVGVAFFLLAGSAMAAGTTRLAAGATASTYASELTLNRLATGNVYTLMGAAAAGSFNSDIYRDMQVARTAAQNFTVVVTLTGATFATGRLPAAGDITVSAPPAGGTGAASFTIAAGGTNNSTSVTFLSSITAPYTFFPTITINVNGWTIKDAANTLATGNITASVQTFDAADGTLVDTGGVDSVVIARATNAIVIPAAQVLAATSAVVDVSTNRQNFVATAPDSTTVDNGATMGIGYATPTPLALNATAFALGATDTVRFTFTSSNDFTGFTTAGAATTGVQWNGVNATGSGTTRLVNIAGNSAAVGGGALPFTFTVNGTTQLPTRVMSVAVDLVLAAAGSTPGIGASRNILGATTVTTWTFNGSVLVANWLTGDSSAFKSRIYLWNPSSLTGQVTVRVFSMPLVSGGTATSTELTTAGSPLSLGSLAGNSSMVIRLYEDILGPAGLNIAPYTTNGGNVVVEVTIRASNVRGTSQVFSNDQTKVFGTVPLQVVQ